MPVDVEALARLVEGGSGADRELDAEIHAAIHDRTITAMDIPSRDSMWSHAGRYYYDGVQMADSPSVTSSLDAAASLVLPGWRMIRCSENEGGGFIVAVTVVGHPIVRSYAPTEPRARTAAWLRARAAAQPQKPPMPSDCVHG